MQMIWNWYGESPHERIVLTLAVLNIIVQKTPWKADDDLLKMVKDILLTILRVKK